MLLIRDLNGTGVRYQRAMRAVEYQAALDGLDSSGLVFDTRGLQNCLYIGNAEFKYALIVHSPSPNPFYQLHELRIRLRAACGSVPDPV